MDVESASGVGPVGPPPPLPVNFPPAPFELQGLWRDYHFFHYLSWDGDHRLEPGAI